MLMSPLIGHRGAAAVAPENTLASIRAAAEHGFTWIELDVTPLADGTLVMFHDRRLNRTTDHRGRISFITADDLAHIDAGVRFPQQYSGEPIATFVDALQLIRELGLKLNLELKLNGCSPKGLVERVLIHINQLAFRHDHLLISSFSMKALREMAKRSDIRLGCLFERLPLNWHRLTKQVNASAIHLNHKRLTPKRVRKFKSYGLEVYAYTVNSAATWQRLQQWGVDGVFTDEPSMLTHQ